MVTAEALFAESQELPYILAMERPRQQRSDSFLDDYDIQAVSAGRSKRKMPQDRHQGASAAIRWLERAAQASRLAVAQAELTRREFRWLAEHRRAYANRWVALEGDNLLAVGNSAREVYAALVGYSPSPLVTQVESAEDICFAGW